MKSLCIVLCCFFSLTACTGKHSLNLNLLTASYKGAVEDLKQGRVMEARTKILSIKKSHKDYKKARSLLRKKINPARLKLLRYYAKKGKKKEKLKQWARAETAYATAAALSIRPKALLRYQKKMALNVRKLRAQSLHEQRKSEDMIWLKWLSDYNPPQGLDGGDMAFAEALRGVETGFHKRLKETWSLANKYKRQDLAEMAWVYADSYLRLAPSTKKAQDLKNAMATAIPKGFALGKQHKQKNTRLPRQTKKKKMLKQEVLKQMKLKRWITAKSYAHILRRQGHPDADKLLDTIIKKTTKLAEKSYRDGNLAFRLERIEAAVSLWELAVKWMPKEQIYLDAWRRGKQIQERVSILRTEESAAERSMKIEE